MSDPSPRRFQCRCIWRGERCPNEATQEDGLCDWCAFPDKRRSEDLKRNPKAIVMEDGKVLLGGAGELHDLGEKPDAPACWYENSGRTLALGSPGPNEGAK